jgi:hypothetical protein|tara:strand:- start:4764 stop:5243 length:480 start_codon:yes stop_codon:yes gene_type:complete
MSIITNAIKRLKTNWAKYRCNPMMMPFAGYAGHDPIENFTQCITHIQGGMMGFFLQPVYFILNIITTLGGNITQDLQNGRVFINEFRNKLANVMINLAGAGGNIIINFQEIIIKIKDTFMKFISILLTVLYLLKSLAEAGVGTLNELYPSIKTLVRVTP